MEILKSLKGKLLGLDPEGRLLAPAGFISGGNGRQRFHDGPDTVGFFEDFLGDVVPDQIDVNKGTDGSAVNFAIAAAVNGTVQATTGANASADMAGNGVQLAWELNWKANQGLLAMEARVKVGATTSLSCYIGFTDQHASLEAPFTLSAGSLTSNATDAVGFLYDTAATASTMKLVGVANDTDATVQDTGAANIGTSFRTYRVELAYDLVASSLLGADFFIDGALVGSRMTSPLTATIALTPTVTAFRRTNATTTVTVDYVHVAAKRA